MKGMLQGGTSLTKLVNRPYKPPSTVPGSFHVDDVHKRLRVKKSKCLLSYWFVYFVAVLSR